MSSGVLARTFVSWAARRSQGIEFAHSIRLIHATISSADYFIRSYVTFTSSIHFPSGIRIFDVNVL